MKYLIVLLVVVFIYSCNTDNEEYMSGKKVKIESITENNMPYLDINENDLKSTNLKSNILNAQISYSAFKRAMKFIEQDSISFLLKYQITSGKDINISPVLQDLIEGIIYFSNQGIEEAIKNNPELKEALKADGNLIGGIETKDKMTNTAIPSWERAKDIIDKYRGIKMK